MTNAAVRRKITAAVITIVVVLGTLTSPPPARADVPVPLSEVFVTGSRIPTADGDETMPVLVMNPVDLDRSGLDSFGKILQMLPQSAASVHGTNLNNAGDGAARVDLRALGPKRTLILLNGHRFPDGGIGGDNSVDIDMLPHNLIDHVEVLTGGASAIYGADAVAGVVNFITKPQLRGLEISVEQSQTDRHDGQISTLQMSAGHELGGGRWLAGGQFVRQRGVSQSARAYSATPSKVADANGDRSPVGSISIPEGVFDVPPNNAFGLDPGYYTHVTGSVGRTAADYRTADPNSDIFNYAPYQYLQTPNERTSIWLLGNQRVSDPVEVHIEALFNHRTSSQSLAPTPFSLRLDPSPVLADGTLGIPAQNYYNPFGADLDDAARRFVELGNRGFQQQVDMHRELASVRFQIGTWSLEPAVSYSQSHAREIDTGAIAGQRLLDALGPSGLTATGQLVCGAPDNSGVVPGPAVIPGCVPVDIFGGVGSIDAAQIAYLRQTLRDHGTNSEQTAEVSARGPAGRTWSGPVQWALGGEYRREAGSYSFDPDRGGGAVGSGGQEDIPQVSYSAREVYAELQVPLARGQPAAYSIDLSGGARYSSFSSFGGHSTWQAGLRWEPVPSIGIRGNYARVFRAPALSELYVAQGSALDSEFDPCGNSPNPVQQSHCAANGVPGGVYTQSQTASFVVRQGGNPQLRPETGYNFDVGIDIRPAALPQIRASLDAYRIRLSGYIATPDPEDLLQQCSNGGIPDICGLITRAPDGSVRAISAISRNLGAVMVSGLDSNIRWTFDAGMGQFDIALQASYLARHDTQFLPGESVLHEAGTYSNYAFALPRWRSLAHVDYIWGRFSLSYANQWVGGYQECNEVDFQYTPYCRRVAGVLYHDVSAGSTVLGTIHLRAGVSNLTNRLPPFLNFGNDANTDTTTYRLLGRTLFAALSYQLSGR